MFLTLLAAVFAACSKDDATYTPIQPLEVTKAEVEYDAAGGNGVITVDASSVEATCSSSWVKLSTSGNTVNVTVDENPGFDGRSARITLKSAGKQADVTLVQKGIIYGINGDLEQKFDNKARSFSLSIVHSAPVTVKSNNDWITASFDAENDLINIQLTQNETGWERIGTVTVSSGSMTDVITISQFDIKDVILGEYTLYYVSSATGTSYDKSVAAELTETSLNIDLSGYTQTIPCKIDFEKAALELGPSASFTGTYGPYYNYLVFRSADGYWTGYSNVTAVATGGFAIFTDEGYGVVDIEFGGKFGERTIAAIALRAMAAEGFSEANNKGYAFSAFYPVLEKVINIGGAQETKKNTLSPFIKR